MTRRKFLNGVRKTGLLAAGATVTAAAGQLARAAAAADSNPYEYNLDRFLKTDPKLIHFKVVERIRSRHEDARRIAVGPNDSMYLAAGKFITVLNKDGSPSHEIALAAPVRCLAVDQDGTVYVGLRDHVEVFDTKGKRLAAWDAPPKAWFTGLAVSEDNVFAADATNRILLRYDKAGKIAGRIGEKNPAKNIPGFVVPSPFFDVEVGRDGLLRVTNPGRHQVEIYTVNGDLEFAWGKPSMGIDGFCGCCNPINIALLPDGRYVTCEKGLPRVKVYSEKGVFESVVAGPESFPEGVRSGTALSKGDGSLAGMDAAADARGRVYVLDQMAGELRIMARI